MPRTKKTRRKNSGQLKVGRGSCLGPKCPSGSRQLGRLNWSASTKRARIIVGAKPGALECWRSRRHATRCTALPRGGVSSSAFDSFLLDARSRQVGPQNVGLTRYRTQGMYQGKEEGSFVYDVIDDGSDKQAFQRHMKSLAEGLSEKFCQDEVLVEYVAADGSTTTRSYTANSCKIGGGSPSRPQRRARK